MLARLKTLKFNLIYLPLFLLGLVLLFTYFQKEQLRLAWVETTRYKLLLYNGPVVELSGDKKLEQTFTANYPGLTQVDILFQSNGRTPGKQKIAFRLKNDCASPNDIVYLSAELPEDNTPAFHPFSFPPLDDSAGQSYCILLEAPEAGRESAALLPLSNGDLYPYGRLRVYGPETGQGRDNQATSPVVVNNLPYKIYLPVIVGQPENKIYVEDIGFQLHYKGLLWPTAQVFVARLTANKPYWLGHLWFYGGLSLVYILLLVGLFYIARKTIDLDRTAK